MERLRRAWDSSNEPASCHAPWVVRIGAVTAAAFCCIQSSYLFGLIGLSKDYQNIICLIDVDWAITHGMDLFGLRGIRLLVVLSYLATMLAVALAGLGCVASKWQAATPICIYFCGSAILAVFFFCMFGQAVTFSAVLEPVIERQGQEFCNATLHWTYSAALRCSMSVPSAALPAGMAMTKCGDECLQRVELLQRLGGCDLLDVLCHRYAYESLGTGMCVVEGAIKASNHAIKSYPGQQISEQCCKLACDTRVRCQGYAYDAVNQTCSVFSPRKPKFWVLDQGSGHAGVGEHGCGGLLWSPNVSIPLAEADLDIAGADGHPGITCKRKSMPELVSGAERAALIVGISFLVVAITLTSAAACGCALQYTVVTRKKGAGGLLAKMMCSCCSQRSGRPRKFGHVLFNESSSDEDSELEDSDS